MAFIATWGPQTYAALHYSGQLGYVSRIVIPSAQISTGGVSVMLVFASRASTSYQIANCFIGEQGTTGTAWDFDGNQVRVTFGGSNGITVGAGTDGTSDAVTFGLVTGKNLVVSIDAEVHPDDDWPYITLSGVTTYQLTGTANVGVTHIASMSANNNTVLDLKEILVNTSYDQNMEVNAVLPSETILAVGGGQLDLTIPSPTIYCNDGSQLGEVAGSWPIAQISSLAGFGEVYAETDVTVPYPTSIAEGGALCTNIFDIAQLYCEAHIDPIADLQMVVPQIQIYASAIQGANATLDSVVPALFLYGSGYSDCHANLVMNLPSIQISADGLAGNVASVDTTLPILKIQSDAYWMSGAIVNAIIPIATILARISGSINMVAMNTKNLSVTRYTNYPFNSMAYLNGVLYGATSTGIYPLSGETDNGAIIPWQMRIEKFDMGIKDYKKQAFMNRMRYVWLTGEFNGDITVTMEDYVGNRYEYPGEIVTASAHEIKVKIGRGLKSRYISIELAPGEEGSNMILDHMELYGEKTKFPR